MFTAAANAMPGVKYGFAPSKAIFVPGQTVAYDGVRTFAQIVTHTAQANYFLFNGVGGMKPEIDPENAGDGDRQGRCAEGFGRFLRPCG